MILVHRLCELNRCASFVVDKGYLVLIFVVFFRHGEDFVVNNVGVLFDDTVIIRCDTGAFTVNRVVLHCQIGLAGPDILFVSVGRTDRLPFNILIGRLCILNKRVDLLFRQCLIRAVRNFIDVEFHIGVLYSPAEVFLFHDQFEERNIVAGIGVGLIVVKTASEHIERASVGRHVGRKRRIALIDSVKSDITCYVIGLGDRVIISLEDHEFRLALLICGLSGMPGIPVFTVRSFVVHLEPGALKLREHRGFRKTAVFEDLDLNSLVVRQCILVVRRSGTVKLIREVLSGFKALHLNRGIFFIDGVFLSLDLRRFHLVDKVGLAAFAFERNDRSIGAVPVINYFRFGNDCLSVFLQHLEGSACELFSGCAVILEDRDAPLKKNIGDCNRYICICLGNHYFILAFFRRARPAVNFHLFDEIAFCLILLQIISPILRKVREHSLGLFDRAVALHSSGGLVLAGLGGNFIAFVILQGEGEAVISCRNTAKIHLFVNDHPDLGKILELQFSCRGFGSVYRIVIRLSRLLDLKLQSAGHHDHLSDRVEFIMSGCFGLYRIVDTGLQTALCDRAVISRCRQSVNFGPGIVVFRECRNRIRFFTCCVECGRIKCMVIKGKLCACQIFDRVLLQIRLDQLQVHIPDVRNSKSKALLVVLILDDLLMQFGTVDTALSARFRCRRIAERIPGAVDQCRVIRILLLEQIDKILIRESVRRTRLSKYERGVRRQHREPGCAAAGRCRLIISCSALRLERECCCCRNSIPVSVFLFDRHFRSGRAVGREDLRLIGHDHREVESKAFVGIEILVTGCCRRHDSSVLARLKPFFEGKAVSVRLEALRAVDLLVCCRAPVLPFPGALVIPLKGETDFLGDEQGRVVAVKGLQVFVQQIIPRQFGIVAEMAKDNGIIISQIIYDRNGSRCISSVIIPYAFCLITESRAAVFKISHRVFVVAKAQGAGDKCDLQVVIVQVQMIFRRSGDLYQDCIEHKGTLDLGPISIRVFNRFSVRSHDIRIVHIVAGIRRTLECDDMLTLIRESSLDLVEDLPCIQCAGYAVSGRRSSVYQVLVTGGDRIEQIDLVVVRCIHGVQFKCRIGHQHKVTS